MRDDSLSGRIASEAMTSTTRTMPFKQYELDFIGQSVTGNYAAKDYLSRVLEDVRKDSTVFNGELAGYKQMDRKYLANSLMNDYSGN